MHARPLILLLLALPLLAAPPGRADVPFPTCADASCADPSDFGAYLFLPPGQLPDDFDPAAGSSWKYNAITGMDIPGAWQVSTGRPDVVIAVLDSGILWSRRDLLRKVALNVAELPVAPGCAQQDCNGDGFVSIDDYANTPDHNGNGVLDGQDLIREFEDGIDDDANGFVDDIAGWDFADGDNDPEDRVEYGHGTGEAEDSTGEADNGSSLPGVAPNAMFLPLKVGDSFVAFGSDFAQAVVYAVDRGAHVVQEALGTLSASPSSQAAIDYAYHRGVPVMASAADEESRHHNFPAVLDHTIWLNSIVHGDGVVVEQEEVYDLLNGCTNYGGRAWVAISSNSCSSEATGRGSGLAGLLVSHGLNLMDAGLLEPYPGLDKPFSAEEIRQLFRRSAEDVDHSGEANDLTMNGFLSFLASAPGLGLVFESRRFSTQPEWDQFTGYGRPNAPSLLDVSAATIPPEADLSGGVAWFDVVDPVATPAVSIVGSVAARRAPGEFSWQVEVGCGVQPTAYTLVGEGASSDPIEQEPLAGWSPAQTASSCGFDPATPIEDPDAHSVTLRLRVTDARGNLAEDRRTLAIHTDPTLKHRIDLGSSSEAPAALADVNRDGTLDVVFATSDGHVHAMRGDTGTELPGFPARTDALPVQLGPGFASGAVPIPHEAVVGSAAADDLDGDGGIEIVIASVEGGLYVFDDHGQARPGFPVRSDPALSDPVNRNPLNDSDPGFVGAPTLVDLDAPGVHPALEIVQAGLDGHVYVWDAGGAVRPGFPVRIADRTKVSIDDATGTASPVAAGVRERATKILGSPAVGDLDGDGRPEIVVPSNEEYSGESQAFGAESTLLDALIAAGALLGDALEFTTNGRLYALHPDGNDAPGGPFLAGWPVAVPTLVPGVLPTVGTGVPGSPALADLDGTGELTTAIFSVAGPGLLIAPDGSPALGLLGNLPRSLAVDFAPDDFPDVPPTAGSPDAPFFPGLGSGAFGDLTGDGLPEYVAPTTGLRKLLDVAAPADQAFSEHQVSAWDPLTGAVLPAFPAFMDDMQFLTPPAIADVTGDGVADVVQGSGAYLLRAYDAAGATPAGFPKFTHGWLIGAPAPGDVDGDGRIEIVASTREGFLHVWDTPAAATEAAIPWQGFGRDRRNTQNLSSGVSPVAGPADPLAGLLWESEAARLDVAALVAGASAAERDRLEFDLAVLDRVVAALEAGNGRLALLLPYVVHDLDGPAQAALRTRLVRALAAAAHGCALCPGTGECPRSVERAARLLPRGDQALTDGEEVRAAWLFARAVSGAHWFTAPE